MQRSWGPSVSCVGGSGPDWLVTRGLTTLHKKVRLRNSASQTKGCLFWASILIISKGRHSPKVKIGCLGTEPKQPHTHTWLHQLPIYRFPKGKWRAPPGNHKPSPARPGPPPTNGIHPKSPLETRRPSVHTACTKASNSGYSRTSRTRKRFGSRPSVRT